MGFPFAGGESALYIERIAGAVPALEQIHIIDNNPPQEWYIPVGKGSLSGGAELVTDASGMEKATGLGNGGEIKFDSIVAEGRLLFNAHRLLCGGKPRRLHRAERRNAHVQNQFAQHRRLGLPALGYERSA